MAVNRFGIKIYKRSYKMGSKGMGAEIQQREGENQEPEQEDPKTFSEVIKKKRRGKGKSTATKNNSNEQSNNMGFENGEQFPNLDTPEEKPKECEVRDLTEEDVLALDPDEFIKASAEAQLNERVRKAKELASKPHSHKYRKMFGSVGYGLQYREFTKARYYWLSCFLINKVADESNKEALVLREYLKMQLPQLIGASKRHARRLEGLEKKRQEKGEQFDPTELVELSHREATSQLKKQLGKFVNCNEKGKEILNQSNLGKYLCKHLSCKYIYPKGDKNKIMVDLGGKSELPLPSVITKLTQAMEY